MKIFGFQVQVRQLTKFEEKVSDVIRRIFTSTYCDPKYSRNGREQLIIAVNSKFFDDFEIRYYATSVDIYFWVQKIDRNHPITEQKLKEAAWCMYDEFKGTLTLASALQTILAHNIYLGFDEVRSITTDEDLNKHIDQYLNTQFRSCLL